MPDAAVVQVQPDRLRPFHQQAAGKQYLRCRLIFAATDIVMFLGAELFARYNLRSRLIHVDLHRDALASPPEHAPWSP